MASLSRSEGILNLLACGAISFSDWSEGQGPRRLRTKVVAKASSCAQGESLLREPLQQTSLFRSDLQPITPTRHATSDMLIGDEAPVLTIGQSIAGLATTLGEVQTAWTVSVINLGPPSRLTGTFLACHGPEKSYRV